jgi:hypothetical protein
MPRAFGLALHFHTLPRRDLMMRASSIAVACFLSVVLVGCEREGPAERAGERIDQSMERAGEKLDEAGDKVEQAARDAGEKLEEAGEEMKEKAGQ